MLAIGSVAEVRQTDKSELMLGEGMPWHILLPFLLLGVLVGINSVRKKDKKQNG